MGGHRRLDGTVRVWDAKTGERKIVFEHPDGVQSVAFDETGELLAAGDRGGSIRLYAYDGETWLDSRTEGSDGALSLVWEKQGGVSTEARQQDVLDGESRADNRCWPAASSIRIAARVYGLAFGPEPGQLVSAVKMDV
jgi:WD40 repeat protein